MALTGVRTMPRVPNRRPQLRIVAPAASPEEAAAVVAALERFMRETAPTPAPRQPPVSGWLRRRARRPSSARPAASPGSSRSRRRSGAITGRRSDPAAGLASGAVAVASRGRVRPPALEAGIAWTVNGRAARGARRATSRHTRPR